MATLSKVYPELSKRAKEVLDAYRDPYAQDSALGGGVTLGIERADRLEMAICEALVKAYCDGILYAVPTADFTK